ncbi:MAG: T9SS type A sorting domain-containing protein [Breznakibacter sp.]
MRHILLFVTFASLIRFSAQAQLSFGGEPYFSTLISADQEIPFVEMNTAEISEDTAPGLPPIKALRFAHPFFVSLNPDNSGKWTSLPDGTLIWRLGIRSTGAFSINLIFDKFALPEGGQLFIFDPQLSTVLGAFTYQSHDSQSVFATSPVPGDELIMEYSQKPNTHGKPTILLSAVNHDYKNIFGITSLKAGYFGDSDESCQPDMSCMSGNFPEKNAVCRLIIDGTELCTGTLVNNTRQDGTPYVITASHCLKKSVTNHSFVALFNYQVPDCNTTIEGYKLQSLSGASVLANMSNIDCLLIQLNQTPPQSYFPYYAGWDLATLPAPPYHSIHHPQGDVKKFARSTTSVEIASFSSGDLTFDALSHFQVPKWSTGTTEGGSSGCGLFTGNGHLVGSLSGGYATCQNPIKDYYYRLAKAWEYQTDPGMQLKAWLDPDNVGTAQLNGIDIYSESPWVRVSNRVTGDSAIYIDKTTTPEVQWMGSNTWGIDAFAERYETLGSCSLHGLYLMAGKSSTSGSLRLKVWSEVLFTENQSPVLDTLISLSGLKAASENLVLLKNSLSLVHPISVSVELPSNQFASYFQHNANRTANSAYLRKDGLWYPFSQVHPDGAKTSSYIDLVASLVVATDTTDSTEDPIKRISVYPNPASTKIYLKWGIDYLEKVEVISLNGQTAMVKPFGFSYGNGESIDVAHLAQGIYLLRFTFKGIVTMEKILVKR